MPQGEDMERKVMTVKAFGDVVKVDSLPKCDFCIDRAGYDARTAGGYWANMCQRHFEMMAATQELGIGKGQRLELIFLEPVKSCEYEIVEQGTICVSCNRH
jgi:hypothetical protein